MKKILVIISIIIILIGAYIGYKGLTKPSGEALYSFETVKRGEIIQQVSVTGSVVSDQSINLQFETSGQVKDIPVSIGQHVLAGDILMSLDAGELQAKVTSYYAALSMAQAKLKKTLEGTRAEEIAVYEAAVQSAQDSLAAAETDLSKEEQDLIDVQNDADEDLSQAYEDALDDGRSVFTKSDNALLVLDDIQEAYFSSSNNLSINVKNYESIAISDLNAAEDSLDIAELDSSYDNIEDAINELQTALFSIRSALSLARTSMDDPTLAPTAADVTSIDTERTAIDTAISTLTAAEQNISSTKVTNQININAAEAAVDQAKDDLAIAQSSLQKAEHELALKKAPATQADIDLARAEVQQANANLLQAQENLKKATLIAPINGQVIKIEYELGETVGSGQTAVSLINTGGFIIEANVSETDISKLSLNDEVSMTLDAFGPDESFEGAVIEIEPAETVISGVIYYKVKSIFEYNDPRIKSGMTVNLDIITDKKEDALYLPFFAIKQKNGNKYVEVLQNNQLAETSIQTGIEGETNIEILEGLTEGQQVITGEK